MSASWDLFDLNKIKGVTQLSQASGFQFHNYWSQIINHNAVNSRTVL